jgi:hypothetical protein
MAKTPKQKNKKKAVAATAKTAQRFGPLHMEDGYIATVARSEFDPSRPRARFFWNQETATANGSDAPEAEAYRNLFLAAPDLVASLTEVSTLLDFLTLTHPDLFTEEDIRVGHRAAELSMKFAPVEEPGFDDEAVAAEEEEADPDDDDCALCDGSGGGDKGEQCPGCRGTGTIGRGGAS